jgi:hypothetical protein
MKKTLISRYYKGCPFGIADFLRASINIHGFCVQKNWNFFIEFSGTPFEHLFETPTFTLPENEQIHEIHDACGSAVSGYLEEDFEKKLSGGTIYKITVNWINITSKLYPEQFIEILKPKPVVIDYINSLNFPKEYLAVHIRLGDQYLNRPGVIDFEGYNTTIKSVSGSLPVIVFSDNTHIKQEFERRYNYIIHDIDIVHTREMRIVNHLEPFLKTIAEFYMIAFSTKVLSFIYSGFSHISSFLYKKEYLVVYDNFHLNYLKEYIKKINQ